MIPALLFYGFVAVVGASIGSFLTLVTYRLPRDEKIGMTRSRCPQCGATLGVRDLFPVLSWALSGGKCRHCKTRVSARYPLTELACGLGALVVVHYFGVNLTVLAIAGLWWSIVAIILTDLEHTIILDEVQVAVVGFGALYHYSLGTPAGEVVTAALVGLGIGLALKYGFPYLRNKDGLGLGDVKFLFGAGVWLASPIGFVPFLFYAGMLGILFGGLWRLCQRGPLFPFGPSLAVALFVCVLWPHAVVQFWQLYGLLGVAK